MHLKAHIFTCDALRPLFVSVRHKHIYTSEHGCISTPVCLPSRFVPPMQVPGPSCVYSKQTPLMNSVTVDKCQTFLYTNAISEFIHTIYSSS